MPLSQRDLKKHLKKFSHDALVRDIATLFKQFENIQEYYDIKFSTEPNTDILKKYKKIIKKHLFPDRGFPDFKLREAKKAISDFKKLKGDPYLLIDLMLFYVEMGVEGTMAYGDINESFYCSMESVFDNACKLIKQHTLQDAFESRCAACCERVKDIGWGFYDGLYDSMNDYFEPNPLDQ